MNNTNTTGGSGQESRVRRTWSGLLSGYWFIPSATVVLLGGLAVALLALDERIERRGPAFAFTGGPDSAREVLSAIASSTLTLTALVFSITIVVLQLASSQFSPRVLKTFLRDPVSQLTLGIFLGTFVHALLLLREVRGEGGDTAEFVPGLGVAASFGLVLVSVGFFVHYIHHIAEAIRVVQIIRRITDETMESIHQSHPQQDEPAPDPVATKGPVRVVVSDARGAVTAVNLSKLRSIAQKSDCSLVLIPRPGDFVTNGMPLVAVHGVSDIEARKLCSAVSLARERDITHDPGFGIRQLVDIAERALSPGINDPSTATQCLDHIHAILRELAGRALVARMEVAEDGRLLVLVPQASWDDYVRLGLDEIRHWGAGSIQIHRRIERLLDDLATVVTPDRLVVLSEQRHLLHLRRKDLPEAERLVLARPEPGQGSL